MTDVHPDAEDIDLLERVRNAAVVLLAELPRSPKRLRIRARGVVLELDWPTSPPAAPEPTPATPPGPVPTGPTIPAPTVGTFYRCPAPGGAPFVQVGDQVRPGQQVAIIEAMKLMLPVEADTAGMITEVLVEDGKPVEYGQDLFALGPVT